MTQYLRRMVRRGLEAWIMALLAVVLLATAAAAHTTTVVKSDPADGAVVARSPARVTAQFNEELDTKQSTMRVVDAGGKQVSEGNGKVDLDDPDHKTMIATLPVALANGAYTVQWRALLTDGDASNGTFQFIVGAATAVSAATRVPTTAAPSASAAAPTQPASAAAAGTATPAAKVQTQAPQQLPGTGEQTRRIPGAVVAGLAAVALAIGLVIARLRGRRAA